MQLLFRLPLLLLELLLRRGADALGLVVTAVRGDAYDDTVATVVDTPPAPPTARATAAPAAPAAPASPPPPTAQEALDRRRTRDREAEAVANGSLEPEAAARVRPIRETPHVDREAEVVESFGPADDVVATIHVDEPWDGYDGMAAAAIVARLRDADPATKGVVRLYEQQHKKRATVLRATG